MARLPLQFLPQQVPHFSIPGWQRVSRFCTTSTPDVTSEYSRSIPFRSSTRSRPIPLLSRSRTSPLRLKQTHSLRTRIPSSSGTTSIRRPTATTPLQPQPSKPSDPRSVTYWECPVAPRRIENRRPRPVRDPETKRVDHHG